MNEPVFIYVALGLIFVVAGVAIYISIRRAPHDYELWHPYTLLMYAGAAMREEILRRFPEIVESYFAGDSAAEFKNKYPETLTVVFGYKPQGKKSARDKDKLSSRMEIGE